MRQASLQFPNRPPPEKRTNNPAHHSRRKSVKKKQSGRSEQQQRRPKRGKQQMLNHVDRQQFLVESSERRAQRHPDQKQPEKKAVGAPARNDVHGSRAKIKPSAQVQECRDNHSHCKQDRRRPGSQCGLNGRRHESRYCPEGLCGWASPSAALRAGAWPAGCNVSRNATSAVVCAGLKFFP